MAAAPGSSARKNARMLHESTTATLPVLIGLDLGSVLCLQLYERIAGLCPQTAEQAVDGVGGLEPREAHRAGTDLFYGELRARCPPKPLADGLGDHHLALAGQAGRDCHGTYLTIPVRRGWLLHGCHPATLRGRQSHGKMATQPWGCVHPSARPRSSALAAALSSCLAPPRFYFPLLLGPLFEARYPALMASASVM